MALSSMTGFARADGAHGAYFWTWELKSVYATLALRREGVAPVVRVNQPVLDAVLSTMRTVAQRLDARPASLDGILALKGVIEVLDEDEREDDKRAGEAAVIAGFGEAVAA